MVQRDEWGYILKIASHTPFHPWAKITAALAQSLDGNREKAGAVSSVGVYTPKFGLGSLENPRMVGRGEVDAGITNPPVTAKLAMEGIGPYRESVGSLRATVKLSSASSSESPAMGTVNVRLVTPTPNVRTPLP